MKKANRETTPKSVTPPLKTGSKDARLFEAIKDFHRLTTEHAKARDKAHKAQERASAKHRHLLKGITDPSQQTMTVAALTGAIVDMVCKLHDQHDGDAAKIKAALDKRRCEGERQDGNLSRLYQKAHHAHTDAMLKDPAFKAASDQQFKLERQRERAADRVFALRPATMTGLIAKVEFYSEFVASESWEDWPHDAEGKWIGCILRDLSHISGGSDAKLFAAVAALNKATAECERLEKNSPRAALGTPENDAFEKAVARAADAQDRTMKALAKVPANTPAGLAAKAGATIKAMRGIQPADPEHTLRASALSDAVRIGGAL